MASPTDPAPPPPSATDAAAEPDTETPGAPAWRYRDGYLRLLHGWWSGLAPLLPVYRTLLEGRLTPEEALSKGSETSAREVLDESLNALARLSVVEVVSAHEADMHYGKPRLRYLFDNVFALHEAVQQQTLQANAWSERKAELAQAVAEGRVARNRLLDGFARVINLLPELQTEFANNRGLTDSPEALSTSLATLSTLLERWLRNPNIVPALELSLFGWNHVSAAQTAADAIEEARSTSVEATSAPRDLPATNILEGRLVTELHELHKALRAAQALNPTVPSMVLGNTLRRVFGRLPDAVPVPPAEPTKPTDSTPST